MPGDIIFICFFGIGATICAQQEILWSSVCMNFFYKVLPGSSSTHKWESHASVEYTCMGKKSRKKLEFLFKENIMALPNKTTHVMPGTGRWIDLRRKNVMR